MIWDVTIKALQPIAIAKKYNAESLWSTNRYIPGSTWRGAFAQIWEYKAGFDHPLADRFVKESIFRDAHLENSVLYPVYYKVRKSGGPAKSYLDELVKGERYRVKDEQEVLYPKCGYDEHPVIDASLGIEISPTREAVVKGKLYTMTSIAEGTVFKTTAAIPEEVLETVCEKLDDHYQCTLYIGKKRSAGYGKAEVIFKAKEKSDLQRDFQKRASQLPACPDDTFVVVLVAKSPLILLDEYLLPTDEIDWKIHIAPIVKNSKEMVDFIEKLGDRAEFKTYGYGAIRDGWQQTWNAMRTSAHVLLPGTAHVTKFKGVSEDEINLILQAIQEIEEKGIGERVQEGFGQVELMPEAKEVKVAESCKNQAGPIDEIKEIKIKEELLKRAIDFAKKTKGLIPISQWQALMALSDPRKELMSTEYEKYQDGNVMKTRYKYYLQRRLESNATSAWKNEIPNSELIIGEALRREISKIEDAFSYSKEMKDWAVKTFIGFLVREQVRLKQESKKGRR